MFRSRPPPTRWVRAQSIKYRSTFAHPGALALSIPRNPIGAVGAQVTFTTAPFNTAICCGLESISVLEISHSDGYSSSAAWGRRSATNAMLLLSGDHAAASTFAVGPLICSGLRRQVHVCHSVLTCMG